MTTGRRRKKTPPQITAEFVRSNFYRVIHADGAFGGISPSGNIRMIIYSEAQRTPNLITYDISPTSGLTEAGRSPEAIPRTIVRELEVDIVMRLQVARALRDWLDDKIRDLEKAVGDGDSS